MGKKPNHPAAPLHFCLQSKKFFSDKAESEAQPQSRTRNLCQDTATCGRIVTNTSITVAAVQIWWDGCRATEPTGAALPPERDGRMPLRTAMQVPAHGGESPGPSIRPGPVRACVAFPVIH